MKIGEILIDKGLLTKAQLKEALEAQLIFGGHLGTCLLELGYITERRLGAVLAEIFAVDYAPPELFENIPRFATDAIGDRLVDRHRVVPFRLSDRTLDVAMVDPKDLLARDELSFATGYKLRPWVAPEARIFQAMERYYDIPRRLRYVTLCKEIDKQMELESAGRVIRVDAMRAAVRPAPVALSDAQPDIEVEAPKLATATAVLDEVPESDPLGPLALRLARAETVDQVIEYTLEHASMNLGRAIIFMVRSGKALPWQATGIRSDRTPWQSLSFTVTTEPMFQLLNGEDVFRGPVPRQGPYYRFYESLGLEAPEEALLVPAHVDDRLVALLYGDGGPAGKVRGEDEHHKRLVRKMGHALSMVHLRGKVLSA